MKLSENERKVIHVAQLKADAPLHLLAQSTKLKMHSVHYYLHRLREANIINPSVLINIYALGYSEYKLYFSLAVEKRSTCNAILSTIFSDQKVIWFSELGGEFQFALVLCAKTLEDVSRFFDKLFLDHGHIFVKKTLVPITSFTVFQKKYLIDSKKRAIECESITVAPVAGTSKLDELDYKILSYLTSNKDTAHREISEYTKQPRSTITLRIARLKELGIIAGSIYLISALKLSMQVFSILVFTKGANAAESKRFFDFCRSDQHIVNYSTCLGSWDFEITAEFPSIDLLSELLQELYSSFPELILDLQTVPIIRQRIARTLSLTT